LDRRTDRSDGSGGASPAVVTSRSADDDLIGDDQDTRSSDVIAPPRQSASTPTAAKSASARTAPADDAASDGTAGGGVSVNGAPASGNGIGETRDASANGGQDASANGSPAVATPKDSARASAADATLGDSVPALPADSIGSSRSTRPKGPDSDRETPDSQASEPSPFDDSPAFSFEPSARTAPAAWTATDPAESAAKPSDDEASSGAPSGPGSSGTMPSGHLSSSVPPAFPPASAEPPALSPAAFAWEMPDPPPNSRSSPARAFLRSGSTAKDPPAPKPASSANPGQTAAGMATAGMAAAGIATADKTAPGEGPVTVQSAPRKAQSKRSKRSARQAHLTIARVEPWSVMKFSFVVSLVAFVILFVAVSVLYATLSGLGVFDSLQHLVKSLTSSQDSAGVNAKVWFTASKVLGYTALLGSLNIVLITAMCTIGSVVYNLTSRLVGGVEVTLRETD
jgi:Transmembrane domain of unknown function (DUF3566)